MPTFILVIAESVMSNLDNADLIIPERKHNKNTVYNIQYFTFCQFRVVQLCFRF